MTDKQDRLSNMDIRWN